MVLNSRLILPNSSASLQPSVSTRIADSYSDNLIDDLFSDVDRILEGDLSGYMTVVAHQPQPIRSSARTVTLPNNFTPRSAAELYCATTSADLESARLESTHPKSAHLELTSLESTSLESTRAANRTPPQAPNDPGIYDAVMLPQRETVQTLPNFAYTDPMPELMLASMSPRSPQTIFEPQRKPQPLSQSQSRSKSRSKSRSQSQSVSLPFLLFGAAIISAVSTLGLWTLSQSGPGHGWLLSLTKEAAAAEIPNKDGEFLTYLQRSLSAISARQAEAQQLSAVVPVAQAGALPTSAPNINAATQVGALPNLPGITPAPSVIERVFVPVYENKTETKAASRPSSNVMLPVRSAKANLPVVPALVAAAAAISRNTPAAAAPSLPVVPANSLPAPKTVAAAPTNAAAAITDVTPASEHVLVGVLNLGSRSAALFDIEGGSQRAYVGDRIGLSNWNLVAVNGQDVVIRRDGEVRSVYIGQKF